MEEESWRRNHEGGVMEEESWRRNHGEGIMEEGSWRRNHEGGIMKEESWRRYHGGGIMGDIIEEASGGHLVGIWRHLGGIWEAPGSHLGGIWETLWELGQPGEPRSDVEEKHAETIVFFHGK